ncbi:MAG: SDR family NAD(P)-dependent oxidoreductase [Aestuariivita sp.]|nr:SDR family NAD(P)-dependent oxidoreductase [Aestuariivita sp.]MCY4203788.1 SDR family NAD(P)-dependent oxidoreductase [Aestuariivita sp.]MCY4289134.1 SDR family NAD(P)-dependent oxidoreductase [Aestuariivita sp.]MCY4347734.1 SDR family NAD(P)-dependent oxidoreductase [Aestuariivita sp.]
MELHLRGKNAVIAGATRGIGRAIAQLMAVEGCNLSICARNQANVNTVVSELGMQGIQAMGASVDAADRDAQAEWINDSAQQLGGIDIFVANVSALNQDIGEEAWRQSFEVDMMATFYGVDAATPFLKSAEAGSMVLISSIAALHTPGGPKPYGAMKAAVINYTKGLARALAPDGIRVNAVSPGNIYFEDGIWDQTKRNNPVLFQKQVEANPMGRMGTPAEVANAVVYLASPAASFISGANLIVDGALTLGVQY